MEVRGAFHPIGIRPSVVRMPVFRIVTALLGGMSAGTVPFRLASILHRVNTAVRLSIFRRFRCYSLAQGRMEFLVSRCSSRRTHRSSSSWSFRPPRGQSQSDSHRSTARHTAYLFQFGSACSSISGVERRGLRHFHRLRRPERRHGIRLCSAWRSTGGIESAASGDTGQRNVWPLLTTSIYP